MHKKNLKRSTFNSLTQKIKTPEHLLQFKDYEDSDNESNFLPSLQTKKTWKDINEDASTWDRNSTATHLSYSSDIEDIATRKVMQQWEIIENTLYEDGEQVTQPALLEECIQWRTQIPHLRIVGKNVLLSPKSKLQELSKNSKQIKTDLDSYNEEVFSEHNFSLKERKISSKHKLKRTPQDEILDKLFEHVMSELFSNNENDVDLFNDDFSDISQIHMTPAHSNKSSAKSTKSTWFEETIPLEHKFPSGRSKVVKDCIIPLRKEAIQTSIQEMQKKYENSLLNARIRSGKDAKVLTTEDKFLSPHTSRNKLGTVFNEKIVVSPVPYVLSTRESFSTVKTTPIKFMGQSLESSTYQVGLGRNISCLKNSGRSSTPIKNLNYQSAWNSSVSAAIWPKNIKLAPLDTSRLVSNKNRFLASSSVVLQRNRKPLSPISRSILPTSAQNPHNTNNEGLEIQGIHISSGQSTKVNTSTAAGDCNAGNKSKKKKDK